MTEVAGCPMIDGARFVAMAARTVIRNAAREAVALPSVTEIAMSPVTPTSGAPGEPLTSPVAGSSCSHEGLPAALNVSESPSPSDAAGRNEYLTPTSAVEIGAPEICGVEFIETDPPSGAVPPSP